MKKDWVKIDCPVCKKETTADIEHSEMTFDSGEPHVFVSTTCRICNKGIDVNYFCSAYDEEEV
jgi:hypothetical protein